MLDYPLRHHRHEFGRYNSLAVVTEPTVLPVSLVEAKVHLRMEGEEEDAAIVGLISAATRYIERRLDISLVDTEWEMRLDRWPAGMIHLPVGNFTKTRERQRVRVLHASTDPNAPPVVADPDHPGLAIEPDWRLESDLTEFDPDEYFVARTRRPPYISPKSSWPSTVDRPGAIVVRWWAGFGGDAKGTPQTLKAALLQLVGGWFMHRESILIGGQANKVPYSVEQLLMMESWGAYR